MPVHEVPFHDMPPVATPNQDWPIAVFALARPTFDVPFAEAVAANAFAVLSQAGFTTVGPKTLLFDAPAVIAALEDLPPSSYRQVLILQVTFTDAAVTRALALQSKSPVAIWAFPEPRLGGRLRLNSFCGLNLALHAIGRADRQARYLYAAPDAPQIAQKLATLMRDAPPKPAHTQTLPPPTANDRHIANRAVEALRGQRIGLIGEHPDGFETCRYDADALNHVFGLEVTPLPLQDLFARARAVPADKITSLHQHVGQHIAGLDAVDQGQLAKSFAIHEALKQLTIAHQCSGLAVRCWPELFTEHGCAACGPMSLLNGQKIPAACEADVLGAVSQKLLQDIAGDAAWLVDIVDMNVADDTTVFWHCGSAPLSMCDPEAKAEAQIHSNRKMPLLMQFPLKPGRITIARVTQAHDQLRLVIGGGEVLRAPKSFTGTSGVVRLDGGTAANMRGLLGHALEHHLAIVYGDWQGALVAAANQLGLPTLTLAAAPTLEAAHTQEMD